MCEIIYEDVEPNEEYEKTIKKVLEECYKTENLTNSKLIITIWMQAISWKIIVHNNRIDYLSVKID